jgi:polysaccharide deacetylase 2 family uncharacterized protein YibQ
MAKKKPDQKKTSQKKPSRKKKSTAKKSPLRAEFKKAAVGLIILLLLVLLAGFLTYYLILHQPPSPVPHARPEKQERRVPPPKAPAYEPPTKEVAKQPTYEVFPPETTPPAISKPIPSSEDLPRVAIIIDDLGYQRKLSDMFLGLDAALTFSLLPYSPFQEHIARSAHEKGFEVMLHLPMEPREYPAIDPGPGTLLTQMEPDQLIDQLIKDLEAVAHIKGVNNHMGSRMTENSDQMNQILVVLKKRGFYFIDSRTTSKSVSRPAARLFQVPFGQRDVFIDHLQEPEFIRKQIAQLIRIAQAQGQAIGIAHPHQITYDILMEMLPKLKEEVQLVPASELVHIIR